MSARHGGKISGHNSHRTGRDVDLLLFYKTPGGADARAPGFIHVESDGLAVVAGTSDYLRFDVVKTWELVKLLVEDHEIRVQFIFASRVLESLLVDYALARGEPLDLVYRAQAVLLEPGDSLNHDDHFHVRIACSPEDEVAGCSGGGPIWEWLPGGPPPFELTHDELHAISTDDPLVDRRQHGRARARRRRLMPVARSAPRPRRRAARGATAWKSCPTLSGRKKDRFDLVYVDPPFNAGGERKASHGRGERASGTAAYVDAWGGIEAFLAMLEPRLAAIRDATERARAACGSTSITAPFTTPKIACDRLFAGRRCYQGEVIWIPGNGARRRGGRASRTRPSSSTRAVAR